MVASIDFLAFALDCVAAEMKIARADLIPIERRLRIEQGGDRHYIASAAALEFQEKSQRVIALARDGVPSIEIAERIGITKRRVNQILAMGSALP